MIIGSANAYPIRNPAKPAHLDNVRMTTTFWYFFTKLNDGATMLFNDSSNSIYASSTTTNAPVFAKISISSSLVIVPVGLFGFARKIIVVSSDSFTIFSTLILKLFLSSRGILTIGMSCNPHSALYIPNVGVK